MKNNPLKKIIVVCVVLTFCMLSACKQTSSPIKDHSSGKVGDSSSDLPNKLIYSSEPEKDSSNTEKKYYEETELEFENNIHITKKRSDAGEVLAPANSAGLSSNYKGYAEAEADALRKEILDSKNTDSYYKITGQKYYISPAGNDENDGKTPKTAWGTLDALSNATLKKGDAVLLERNSVYRITSTVNLLAGVVYGSYGSGTKPQIYASPKNYAAKGIWEPSNKKNVWKTGFAYKEAGSMVFDHGKSIGIFKSSGIDALNGNEQYYQNVDDGSIYLYCDKGNPSNHYKDIEICPSYSIFSIDDTVSDITIDNLCLKYTSLHGISFLGNNSNINITNCELGYIGGSRLNGGVRHGNAVQFWWGCTNVKVENNWMYQTFDSAVTWQGNKGIYQDISFSRNLFEYNNADVEFWAYEEASLSNFKIENNIMRFTSLGWGTRKNDAGLRGIEGCIKGDSRRMDSVKAVSIKNNIFDCIGKDVIAWSLIESQKNEIKADGNKLILKGAYREVFGDNAYILKGFALPSDLRATNQSELDAAFDVFDHSGSSSTKWYD